MNFYNDIDPKCCAWTQELINARLIPPGDVLCKSILDIKPHELEKYTQVHLFCGIAGWPYALRLAGWPDDRSIITASAPCQPLSCAGKRKGHADERHLWPALYALIAECKFPVCVGEQVASANGREWLAGIRVDLEGAGYRCGCANLCAAGAGAPHIRQRLFWCAVRLAESSSRDGGCIRGDCGEGVGRPEEIRWAEGADGLGTFCEPCRLADAERDGRRADEPGRRPEGRAADGRSGEAVRLADAHGAERGSGELRLHAIGRSGDGSAGEQERAESGMANSSGGQRQQLDGAQGHGLQRSSDYGAGGGLGHSELPESARLGQHSGQREESANGHSEANPWRNSRWHACRDGKARRVPVEPALFPLADGIPGRVGLLRGAGNAIVPQVAAEFIRAAAEAIDSLRPAASASGPAEPAKKGLPSA